MITETQTAIIVLQLTDELIGEALDRIAFYENLEPSTPARRMVEDAQRLSAA